MKLGVLGAGRMGRAILRGIAPLDGCRVGGVWLRRAEQLADKELLELAPAALHIDLHDVVAASDVLLDFTLPGTTAEIVTAATKAGVPLVCGVSGLQPAAIDQLASASRSMPVLYDRNMSIGVAVLQQLVAQAAAILQRDFEAEVHETHHVHKIDAPSGTALKLGETLARARGRELAEIARYDDEPRQSPADIIFRVTRQGEVAGDHSVHFLGTNETLMLRHFVEDRQVFADGAIRAAGWLQDQPPGLYNLSDVVAIAGE